MWALYARGNNVSCDWAFRVLQVVWSYLGEIINFAYEDVGLALRIGHEIETWVWEIEFRFWVRQKQVSCFMLWVLLRKNIILGQQLSCVTPFIVFLLKKGNNCSLQQVFLLPQKGYKNFQIATKLKQKMAISGVC